jgi:hypothetical protein
MRVSSKLVVGVFAGLRTAIGAAFAVAPSRLAGSAQGERGTLLARSFAVREFVLGIGGLVAVAGEGASSDGVRMWAGLGALTDAGDLTAALLAARRREPSAGVSALVAATGLAAELWALRQQPGRAKAGWADEVLRRPSHN